MLGSPRRAARIAAEDGRSLIVAFDHGMGGANYSGMASPGRTLDEVISAGADAVLTTIGIAEAFSSKLNRVGLILNLDLATGNEESAVRAVMAVGAEMGKFILTPWNPEVPDSVARAQHLAAVCHQWGLPLMVEPIPVSFSSTESHTPERIGQAARIACEIGADVVKMQFTGDARSFQQVMGTLYRPVVILGGPERSDDRSLLQGIHDAISAGAIGIAIGRNIWNRERPGRMVAALGEIIHGGGSVEAAMRELGGVVAVA
jgi:class I fructose-bisphosphate aldolase/fructose-bisphosphate aldolase/2-amino-3,7-dideoxy-D-threo-hept-6-ulosonate synthase